MSQLSFVIPWRKECHCLRFGFPLSMSIVLKCVFHLWAPYTSPGGEVKMQLLTKAQYMIELIR